LDTERVALLRAQGHSLREIAGLLSTSLGAVQRALKRRPVSVTAYLDLPDGDDLDEDAGMVLLDGTEVEHPGPFVFVGVGDAGEVRLLDSKSVSCGLTAAYRWCMARDEESGWTGSFWEDLMAQIAAAGARQVPNPQRPGYTMWVQD
jgi:hypothetical protein